MSNEQQNTYADFLTDLLVREGYTHCFFVAGGNIMHLLNSCRSRFKCVPVVHEVAAGIATEYFNEVHPTEKAFALVTAGPGLTNIVTAISGAWLEHRELLCIGGQVKSSDLMTNGLRQRGIQEVDGVSIVDSITCRSVRVDRQFSREEIVSILRSGCADRPGPVFLEVCLDVQGSPAIEPIGELESTQKKNAHLEVVVGSTPSGQLSDPANIATYIQSLVSGADRPVFLIGAGVDRDIARTLRNTLEQCGVPIVTTWHAADRYSSAANYFGRADTWGQRAANLIINQADLLIAFGARLGLQETGFNVEQFVPNGKIIQIDIDESELRKGHPKLHLGIKSDANTMLRQVLEGLAGNCDSWLNFCSTIREAFPLNDRANKTAQGYVDPYSFYELLPTLINGEDVIIPSSSGGSNSVAIQALRNSPRQTVVCDNGLASMGYGLSGAIGAAFARPEQAVWLVEGDGGFCQNLQELGTVAVNSLNLKIFIFANNGYGSIRTTQRNYFGGAYVGCDIDTGLGFPQWELLANAFGIPFVEISSSENGTPIFPDEVFSLGPILALVPIDPDQTYWPKITSFVTENGSMISRPTSDMTPELSESEKNQFAKYL